MKDIDEMKLARVIDACGGVDGRVKMQKIVYLLRMMGYDLPYDDFMIRQQGPFSRAVACDTDVLKGAGIIEEDVKELDTNECGEPIRQYSYSVRDAVAPLIRQHFDVPGPAGKPPVNEVAGELKKRDRAVLKVAATKVFLERHDKLSGVALDGELRRLKGHLANRFADADQLLRDMSKRGWL